MAKVLVEISTKDRDPTLGSVVACLLSMTYTDWDLLIINDGSRPVGYSKKTEYMLSLVEKHGHKLSIIDGSHISQAHNHNFALYRSEYGFYEYIFRCDDDLLMNVLTLEHLVETIESSDQVAAVGGLWFDVNPPEDFGPTLGDRKLILGPVNLHAACTGKVWDTNSNWQQRMYHPTNQPYEVQHIYSNCLYSAQAMRHVGGWPEVYSHGVAHGEETDGTYRLFCAGYKLLIDPRVTGNHLRIGGGIRNTKNVGQVQSMDLLTWQARWKRFKDINFERISVGIACPNHQYGLGGAERLFYHLVHLLQQFTSLDVYPVFTGKHYTPDQCEEAFGFSFEDRSGQPIYDVGIVIGHELNHPFNKGTMDSPEAKQLIHYTLFPIDVVEEELQQFSRFIGISDYTQGYIESRWRVRAGRIYPPVEWIGNAHKKENIILVVARCVPSKAPLWMMEKFVEFGLKDEYELHVVSASSVEAFDDYERQVESYARSHPTIIIHKNISVEELHDLYRKAKVLWTANGMMSQRPEACEHFGYTPPEAFSAGCIPIAYDRGGHKETVPENLRWSTAEELEQITKSVLANYDKDIEPVLVPKPLDIVEQWQDEILRVNGMAFSFEKLDPIHVSGKIRVAMLSDSPYLPEYGIGVTTGFGVVAGQIVKEIIKDPSIELNCFGMLDSRYLRTDRVLPFNLHTPLEDLEAKSTFPRWLQAVNPDVIFILHAPGEVLSWVEQLKMLQVDTPIVSYFPVEGAHRINSAIPRLLELVDFPVTYCKSGADMIEQYTGKRIRWLHHGADHAPFAPSDPQYRERVRELLDWEDKFVVGMFGTNKRGKNFPVLIRAMRYLLERGIEDVIMYFHTKIFDNHVLQGWHLKNIIDMETTDKYPVSDHIYMPIKNEKFKGVPFDQTGVETWKLTKPTDSEGRCMLLSSLPLIVRYGLLDLYFDSSAVEGHGLPPLEAAACGVPVVTVNDGVARTEIHSKYCSMISPVAWETWNTGTDLAILDPRTVADIILKFRDNVGKIRERYSKDPHRILEEMPWERTAKAFVDILKEAYK